MVCVGGSGRGKKLSVVLVTKPNQFPKRAVRVSVEETVCVCVVTGVHVQYIWTSVEALPPAEDRLTVKPVH